MTGTIHFLVDGLGMLFGIEEWLPVIPERRGHHPWDVQGERRARAGCRKKISRHMGVCLCGYGQGEG